MSFLLRIFVVVMCVTSLSSASWEATTWRGEKAWSSSQGSTLAVVSQARSRLIYFGKADGSSNALSAPTAEEIKADKELSPNWGGHRFWLGPQKRWSWPPLPEWEHAAAAKVEINGDVLVVTHEQRDRAYPALTRTYHWTPAGLQCGVRWHDDGRPYFAMHVFAIQVPVTLRLRLKKWDLAPAGWVDIRGDQAISEGMASNRALVLKGNHALITSGKERLKAGFSPQTIEANTAAGVLSLSPSVNRGVPLATPDLGYVSQVWVGAYEGFAELEQLTPYLQGDSEGVCESSVVLGLRID